MKLTQEQLDHYHEKGWVVVPKAVDLDKIAQIKRELANVHDELANEDHPNPRVAIAWEQKLKPGEPKKIWQLLGSEIISPTLNEAITSDDMLDMVEQIIGPDITLYHSKLLMKEPHVGESIFPWHQDYSYWCRLEKEPTQVNCAIAIDPQTRENGCLHYVPGSHKQGLIEHKNLQTGGFNLGLGTDINQFEAECVEYDRGDICFFGPLVIHGSEHNRTDESATFNTTAYDKSGNHRDPKRAANPVLRKPIVNA